VRPAHLGSASKTRPKERAVRRARRGMRSSAWRSDSIRDVQGRTNNGTTGPASGRGVDGGVPSESPTCCNTVALPGCVVTRLTASPFRRRWLDSAPGPRHLRLTPVDDSRCSDHRTRRRPMAAERRVERSLSLWRSDDIPDRRSTEPSPTRLLVRKTDVPQGRRLRTSCAGPRGRGGLLEQRDSAHARESCHLPVSLSGWTAQSRVRRRGWLPPAWRPGRVLESDGRRHPVRRRALRLRPFRLASSRTRRRESREWRRRIDH